MVEAEIPEGEGEDFPSLDAFVVAEAIREGLFEIAKSIRETQIEPEDYGNPQEPETYMDGTPIT
jgi:hypothetical protein